MYITINNIKGEKRIDLSYSIHSDKEIAVIRMLSDNVQYEILKIRAVMDPISNYAIYLGRFSARAKEAKPLGLYN